MKRNIVGAVAFVFAVCVMMSAMQADNPPPCDPKGSTKAEYGPCSNDPSQQCHLTDDNSDCVANYMLKVYPSYFKCTTASQNPWVPVFGSICRTQMMDLGEGVTSTIQSKCYDRYQCNYTMAQGNSPATCSPKYLRTLYADYKETAPCLITQ